MFNFELLESVMKFLKDLKEIKESEVHFGAHVSKINPMMKNFIYKKSKRVHIIDWKNIISSCHGLEKYLKKNFNKESKILFLSTNKKVRDEVKNLANECQMPFIIKKWKGGFLTNFYQEVKRKIYELNKLSAFIKTDEFKELHKKEQAIISKRWEKLNDIYEGVSNLENIPNAIFVLEDLSQQKTALAEAKRIKLPIISVCNTNSNPAIASYSLFGNNDNPKSLIFFAKLMSEVIKKINNES